MRETRASSKDLLRATPAASDLLRLGRPSRTACDVTHGLRMVTV
ncbi:CRISPR-associated DxTHG motif protein [Agromyces sp. Q22]|uniref:CRISPR-associated DxTHG motif protein n=1 Tax=Agromyces kandeliae TaxID=2666141 RepID=A0A6L5R293_9MICO|nr:CRISPR-associated DxTHG motif protein [Agromyces kandeliae]